MLQSYLFVLLSYVENNEIDIKNIPIWMSVSRFAGRMSDSSCSVFLVNGWSKGIPCEKT